MESNKIFKVVIVCLLIIIAGILFTVKKSDFSNPGLSQKEQVEFKALRTKQSESATLFQSPESPTLGATSCKNLKHSTQEYYKAWKDLLKQENSLSEEEYNQLIRITSVGFSEGISGEGTSMENRSCKLLIFRTIKVDWVFIDYSQYILLSDYNRIPLAPDSLSTSSEVVNDKVSSINSVQKKLIFTNIDAVADFYINKYKKIGNSNPRFDARIEILNNEPFIRVWGRFPRGEKACVTGTIGLITRQTTYSEDHCIDPMPLSL